MGTAMSPAESGRIVELDPTKRSMNVAYRERVIFWMNGKSFGWCFDVMPTRAHVDLSEIAPAGFPMREFRAFVAASAHGDPTPRPRSQSHALHEHAGEVALIDKTAGQGYFGERLPALA
jgi:hypothetical protein